MSEKISWRHLGALLVVFALGVAACGDGDGAGTTAATDEVTDPIGVVEVQPGDSVQIRAHQAISGAVSFLGTDQVRGVELALEDFPEVLGFPVELGTPEDDLCRSEGGQSGAQNIVAQENVVAVIGTTCSGAAAAAVPIYSAAGLSVFSGSVTGPSMTSYILTNPGTPGENYHEGFFRTAHNDEFQGASVADFVFNELGFTRAAAVHDGDPYTQGLATAFQGFFEILGGEVPLFTAVDPDQTDMTALLTDIAAADVEVVYFPIFQPAGDFIITQKDGIAGLEDVVWFGADGLFVSDFLGIPESEGMYFSSPDLGIGENVSATGVTYDDLRQRYIDTYGEDPTAAFHAHTYDATIMVLTAIGEVGVVGSDGVLRIPRQGLRDHLADMEGFAGLTGTLGCLDFGDCGSQAIMIAHHTDTSITDLLAVEVAKTYGSEDFE